MSHKNFQSVSRDGSAQGLKSGSISMDHIVASGRGSIFLPQYCLICLSSFKLNLFTSL